MAIITRFVLILVFLFPSFMAASQEEEELQVTALFKNAAMVQYRGKQKLYRNGASLSPNIKLISASPRSAIFLINGKKQELTLRQIGSFADNYTGDYPGRYTKKDNAKVTLKTAKILRNQAGMFRVLGFINGVSTQMLVDTGASQVAMNESVAKKLNIQYRLDGDKTLIHTAAGVVEGWTCVLKKVKVGEIELQNVEALVVSGDGPSEVLLGMSFLSQVKMQNDGHVLELHQKF